MTFEIGEGVTMDLERLVTTRLLVQANSGGGKSWLLRRLLEQTAGAVQQLVIDAEGEFSTLREKYDYVLAAKNGGDTAADPRTAALLAERLLKLNVSAILDIYELPPRDRVWFVKNFLTALVDAPKELWHPVLVVVDEAHTFCPEGGDADSSDAVKALATRGRKRGFCAVFATQRLSKFAKDAAAECNNKLIGRTALDVDVKRAADELGFAKTDASKLRILPPGKFYAYGPAFGTALQIVQVGPIKTRHPEAGGRLALAPPPPSAKVKALLPTLADLPAEVAEREASVERLTKEVNSLKRELAAAARPAAPAPTPILTDADRNLLGEVARALRSMGSELGANAGTFVAGLEARAEQAWKDEGERFQRAFVTNQREFIEFVSSPSFRLVLGKLEAAPAAWQGADPKRPGSGQTGKTTTVQASAPPPRRPAAQPSNGDGEEVRLNRAAERRILAALAQHPGGRTIRQICVLTGYAKSGGGFGNAMRKLRKHGYIADGGPDLIAITGSGLDALGPYDPLPTGKALVDHWLRQFNRKAEREILEVVVAAYPTPLDLAEIAARTETGYEPTGGGFGNAVRKLKSLDLLVPTTAGGLYAASPNLFD